MSMHVKQQDCMQEARKSRLAIWDRTPAPYHSWNITKTTDPYGHFDGHERYKVIVSYVI